MSERFVDLIDETLASIDGEVLDKSRVIDRLLDLRNEAGGPAVLAAVDAVLRGVPGRTLVANAWWSEVLTELRIAAELEDEKTVAH
jgi:hypothetical protein